MKKYIATLLLICLLLTGCTGYTHYPVLINNVEIKTVPQSVISFDNYTYCNMCSLGFKDKLVGDVADFGTALSPNTALLLSLDADILISSTEIVSSCKEALNKAGILVVVIPPANALSQMIDNYVNYYKIMLGNDYSIEARELISDYIYDELGYIKKGVTKGNKAYFIIKPNFVATSDTYINEILTDSGFDNIATGSNWNLSSIANPDVIICDDNYLLSELRKSDFADTNAVKNNRIATVNIESFECQSIDMFETLRESVLSLYDPNNFPTDIPTLLLSYTEPDPPTLFESIGQFFNDLTKK